MWEKFIFMISVRSNVFIVELYTVVDDVDEHYMKQTRNIYLKKSWFSNNIKWHSNVLGVLLLMLIITWLQKN